MGGGGARAGGCYHVVLFAFLVVSIKFLCIDKVGIVSKESKTFSEVLRILPGGEFYMYGVISIIDV